MKLRFAAVAVLAVALVASLRAQNQPESQTQPAAQAAESTSELTPARVNRLRAEGIEYYNQLRYEEALETLEKIAAASEKDGQVQLALGISVIATAHSDDPAERKAQRARGRKLLVRAKELGTENDLAAYYLRTLPEDGGDDAVFSSRKEVNEAMQEGEQAFGKHQYKEAIAAYTRAMLLDPNLYSAVLFIGDSYFAQGTFGSAGEWFERATRTDPDRETAYRYWGDALLRQDKNDEARSKFIEAVVAEPYDPQSWVGLKQWARFNSVELTRPDIKIPDRPTVSSAKPDAPVNITLNINDLQAKDGSNAWMTYQINAGAWRMKLFKEFFPNEKEYRHTLREESMSLAMVANNVSDQLKRGSLKEKNVEPGLKTLVKLKDAGLIEPFILLSRPDEGIAQDYAAYRKEHRDKLRQYLDEYVVPKTPKS